MAVYVREYAYTSELLPRILADIGEPAGRAAAERIIRLFEDAGLTIKVKHLFPEKPETYYRVLCFIKKSKEAVIINTKTDNGKEGVSDGMNIQLRIENAATFDRLEAFSDNVCDRILNAHDCRHCSAKCEGKQYAFTHRGKEYLKCHFICSNFQMRHIGEDDVDSIMTIVNNELIYKKKP